MRSWLALLILAVLAPPSVVLAGAPKVGSPAPAFVGRTLEGDPLDLAALRGHVVVVNLWATWCPPCRAEMPMLDAFYKAHQGAGLVLVGLSADHRRDLAAVKKVMSAFSYPAALREAARTDGFGEPDSLPMTYVLNGAGRVTAVFDGARAPLTPAVLDQAVDAAARAQ